MVLGEDEVVRRDVQHSFSDPTWTRLELSTILTAGEILFELLAVNKVPIGVGINSNVVVNV